ncbi:MAG: ATP-dependent DNA helicase RecG [Polyangiales bacterium]
MTREELLPLLQRRVQASDATPLSEAEIVALRALGGEDPAGRALLQTAAELAKASKSTDIRVLAARAMRELAQLDRAREAAQAEVAPEAPAKLPDRRERDRARVARGQAKALAEHRTRAERPSRQPVETLSGVGETLGQALRARGLRHLGDLLWLLPTSYLDERVVTPLDALIVGERQVVEATVVSARPFGGGRNGRMAEVWLAADSTQAGALRLTWFRAPPGLLARFTPGSRYRAAGVIEEFRGQKQITHPETAHLAPGRPAAPRGIVPRYPTVAGVPPRKLASIVQLALARALADLDEAVPPTLQHEYELSSLQSALRALHAPPNDLPDGELRLWNEARTEHHARLAFEEFFLLELALFRRRVEDQGISAEPIVAAAAPLERVRDAFGFALTEAQLRASREIFADLARTTPMRRLLQGDVGSGKTAVAMLASAQCVAAGAQVALMAPTEILAEQHFRSVAPIARALGMRAALVLGGERASHRKKTRKALEEGTIDLAVGTHALLSEGVRFARLRLVIIDEQHRFGVGQRLRLVDKTERALAPHLLVMTATPIPRTLALALHGDLEASVIDEMPAGRIPPVTRAYPIAERERALVQLERALQAGGQAYVVCPSIEESAETGLSAVEKTFAELAPRLAQYGVALLHGRLKSDDKQAAMERFVKGEARVLISTTIVEVGVDVPRANLIMIENAERFGLAQLHQLRGRVGRSGQRSACLLVHQAVSLDSRARIEALCETHDGFRLAEEDLRLRGPGELFGHRQSGLPGFRFGDLRRDAPLLARARDAAQRVVERDPELTLPEHAAARTALERWNEGSRSVVREEAG